MSAVIERMRRIIDEACSDPTLGDTARTARRLLAGPTTEVGQHIGFSPMQLVDIYRFRDKRLTSKNIDHGGFAQTIEFFSSQTGEIEVLTCMASGYLVAIWLDPANHEEFGIIYVEQGQDRKSISREEFLRNM